MVGKANGGILLVDEIHRHPDLIATLSRLITKAGDDVVVILSGLQDPIKKYFDEHPDDLQRWGHFWPFPGFSVDELAEITLRELSKGQLNCDEELIADLPAFIAICQSDPAIRQKNAWLIERHVVRKLMENQGKRLAAMGTYSEEDLRTLTRSDLPLKRRKSIEEVLSSLDSFVGFAEIKGEIKRLADTMRIQEEQVRAGGNVKVIGAHMIITGNPGTGKTTLARKLGQVFEAIGMLDSGHVVEVDRSGLVAPYVGHTAPNVNAVCEKAKGGILFIDEAYTLKPGEGQQDSFGQEAIDTLLKRMEDDRGKFVVVVAGYREPMERFIGANEGLKSRFTYRFDLRDYSAPELFSIFGTMLRNDGGMIDKEAAKAVEKSLERIYAKRDKSFANGRSVRNLLDTMEKNRGSRLAALPPEQRTSETLVTFALADVPVNEQAPQDPEIIFKELDTLIGLTSIKKEMRELYQFLQVQKKRELETGKASSLNLHFIFTGNPGTGKTTVARILGKLFFAIGLLPDSKVIDKGGKQLVGQYVGQTAKIVDEIVNSALGGVLFVDEAYTLAPDGGMDSFSKDAIDTLLKRLEDDRGRFICIAAGYKKEMQNFLNANPGLPSRFTRTMHFDDYRPEELYAIFDSLVKGQGYVQGPGFAEAAQAMFAELFEGRDEHFGNAREVRTIFERTIQNQAARLGTVANVTTYTELTVADLPGKQITPKDVEDPLETLQKLIGLETVKKEVQDLVAYLKVEAQRAKAGDKTTALNLHMVLTGNPGTGKTTVAKLLGAVFKQLGLLKKGHVVETDRAGLVDQYVGGTALKTKQKIDDAMGGLLFIDEAYALAPEVKSNDFGREAIDTLLKRMEDDRGKFIVLAAGYKGDMERFLASNDGLRSRFARFIHFDDYTAEEMVAIFRKFLKDKGLTEGPGLEQALLARYTDLYAHRDNSFANGRTVRNGFERSLQKQSLRLAKIGAPSLEQLRLFTVEDLA